MCSPWRAASSAVREEGDWFWFCCEWRRRHFYPRPPRGGRPQSTETHPAFIVFLSTPSARRATGQLSEEERKQADISIHALREEGDHLVIGLDLVDALISIHALREEGDSISLSSMYRSSAFLSTPSARRATCR